MIHSDSHSHVDIHVTVGIERQPLFLSMSTLFMSRQAVHSSLMPFSRSAKRHGVNDKSRRAPRIVACEKQRTPAGAPRAFRWVLPSTCRRWS